MTSSEKLALGALCALAISVNAYAADLVEVKCPVVADRQTGKYSKNKAKYRCFKKKSGALQSGYSKHSYSESSSCTPTPTPSGDSNVTPGDYNLNGPGERESVVFSLANGGTVEYYFPGGGEFEIKVKNASSDKDLQDVLETYQATSGSLAIAAQSVPVYVKVEGPGAWEVAVHIDK